MAPLLLGWGCPDTRTLCQTVLNEQSADAKAGANTALNWLNGELELVIASQRDTANDAQELFRGSLAGTHVARPEVLLRASDEPERMVNHGEHGARYGSGLLGRENKQSRSRQTRSSFMMRRSAQITGFDFGGGE